MRRNGPDYMLIGAQKAGSTWIYENLIRHPHIDTPEIYPEVGETELTRKEITFFNDYHRHAMGKEFYLKRFDHVSNVGRIVGDHTYTYHDMPAWAEKEVADWFPMLKVILSIRNPVDRAWSQAKMHFRIYHGQNVREVPERDVLYFFAEHYKFGCYTASMAVWKKHIPEHRFKIVWFEDIAQKPLKLLGRLCEFLGVSAPNPEDGYPLETKFVKGSEEPMPQNYRRFLEQMFEPEIRALGTQYPHIIDRWMDKNK